MRTTVVVCLTYAGLLTTAVFPRQAFSQVPTAASEPVVRVPSRAAPVAQSPGQPTTVPTAAAPAEPAPVTAAPPPSGATQLPPAAPPPATASSSAAATAKDSRAYSAAKFSLTLDGYSGFLKTVEGGAAVADVAIENVGPDNISKKHAAGLRYEEISFEIGLEFRAVNEWIRASWERKFVGKSGRVQLLDYSYKIQGYREFMNALITGTTIPALDAGSREPAYLTVTIASEQVRELAGDGSAAKVSDTKTQRPWLLSNFRFAMGDLPTSRVSRIESFTVGQKVAEDQVGASREAQQQPSTLVFPNLKITLSQADAADWAKWHNDIVVNGKNDDAQEKNGAIVFLDNAMKDELGRINLFNCGIFRFGAVRREANADQVARVTADLYCERMEFAMGAATAK